MSYQAHSAGEPANGSPPSADEVEALRAIIAGTARNVGEEFFQSLLCHLAAAIDVHYAFVAEFVIERAIIREDLYYRLSAFPLQLPPLRERRNDIPLLVRFLINKFAMRLGKRFDGIGRETMQRLLAYPWPGNVRELENVIERAVILANSTLLEIDADALWARGRAWSPCDH